MHRTFRIPTLAALLWVATTLHAERPDDLVGDWRTKGGQSIIHLERKGTTFQGAISWLKKPLGDDGKPLVDTKNPDESQRTRPILGLPLLRGFQFDGKNAWTDGHIYDPNNGKEYSCEIKLDGTDKLSVHGYIGISLLGRTETWERATSKP
jgi:uncharacterized protein (DUF2147 family)